MDYTTFLQENSSAIFGLLGVLAGGVLSFVSSFMLKRQEFGLRAWDKLLERRMGAHERVLEVAQEMRLVGAHRDFDTEGELGRLPIILLSPQNFQEWFTRFTSQTQNGRTWMSTGLKRELSYIQDYLVQLNRVVENLTEDECHRLGVLIRQDFIDMASSLENAAYSYFSKEINKLALPNLDDWHKYPIDQTNKRFSETRLFQHLRQLESNG